MNIDEIVIKKLGKQHKWFKLYFYVLGYNTLNIIKTIFRGLLATVALIGLIFMWVLSPIGVLITRHNYIIAEKKFSNLVNSLVNK